MSVKTDPQTWRPLRFVSSDLKEWVQTWGNSLMLSLEKHQGCATAVKSGRAYSAAAVDIRQYFGFSGHLQTSQKVAVYIVRFVSTVA